MPNRYIYISEVLNDRLKLEESASALISRLLNEFYKTPEDEKKEEEKKEKEVTQERERREIIRKKYLEHKSREPNEKEYLKEIAFLDRCQVKLTSEVKG